MFVRVVTDAHDITYLHSLSCWDVYIILSVSYTGRGLHLHDINLLAEYMNRITFGASDLALAFFTPGVVLLKISMLFCNKLSHVSSCI